ncbi:DsbA family protein [Candidatus Woesearchaeota archaeon]|nr:DsbA family protein [Candidatus Woesearchaeota archaeon]
MAEEKTHEHSEHHKKHETVKFEISKVRIWQGLAVILALVVVFMWFNSNGSSNGAAVGQPSLGQNPSQAPQIPTKQNIDLDDDPVLGDPNAPVTIVSFEDFQCPFCGRAFQQTFPLLKKDYIDTGKVKYVYRDFPLSFHPEAQPAAEAAECADEQGKFWEFHEGVFSNQATMGRDLYLSLAGELGLDAAKFTQCIDSGKYRQEVQNDFAYGSQVGVSGTPTFFINGIQLVGAQPYQAFQQVIEAELANQ